MKKRQLIAVFLGMLIPFSTGNGLIPLLPLYAKEFNASPTLSGYFLSIIFFWLSVGSFFAGWVSDRFQKRKLTYIIVGTLNIVSIWLMGQVNTIGQLIAVTSVTWFLGGTLVISSTILAGLFVEPDKRGQIFGILGLSSPLASLLGGSVIGQLTDLLGFSRMLTLVALIWFILPVIGIFMLEDKVIEAKPKDDNAPPQKSAIPFPVWLFLIANTLAWIPQSSSQLGISLSMNDLGFTPGQISSTVIVSGLVTLPLTYGSGWLSDRIDRRILVGFSYIAATIGLLFLIRAGFLWQFWVAISFITMLTINRSVGSALVLDLVDEESLGRSLSLLNVTPWVAGIIGFGTSGALIDGLGIQMTFISGAVIPLVALVMLFGVRRKTRSKPIPG